MTKPLTGLMPACPTSLTAEGDADVASMKAVVRHMLDNGASGLVPLGGTGEYTSLSPETRVATIEACVEAASGAPVYAGVLAPGLGDALPAARSFAVLPSLSRMVMSAPASTSTVGMTTAIKDGYDHAKRINESNREKKG